MTTFPVTIRYHAPHAHTVSVVGSFAEGKPHSMRRSVDGYWHVTLELKRGRYEYRLLVDDVPTLDPKSHGSIVGANGDRYSLLEVGY